ncbi:MAG TPA: hypothetical protein VF804_04245 [Holophagaceae bacterium]
MRVHFRDLPAERASALKGLVLASGRDQGAWSRIEPRLWLAVMGLLGLGAGLVSAWSLRTGAPAWPRPADAALPWVGLLGLAYGPLALAEYLRTLQADLRPFLLLTPFNLVRSRGSHRPLEMYRLSEACGFQRIEEYRGSAWAGQGYAFEFDGGDKVHFTLHRRGDIEAADHVLALARAAGRGEPLPDLPGCRLGDLGPGYRRPTPEPGTLERLLDPASETWLMVLGILLIAFVPYAIFR